MDALEITLLDRFQLCYSGGIVDTVSTSRQQALIAYLLLHRDAPTDRGQLAYLFWPETSEKQARSNLRTLFHRVRSLLPDADRFIQLDCTTVVWRVDAQFTLDVAAFEDALRVACKSQTDVDRLDLLVHAVDLYGGLLLPHLYDEWLNPHRVRLHGGYVETLRHLVTLHENRRDYAVAIQYGHRLLDDDPLREETYRCLMRLHALAGDPARALQLYADATDIFARELDIEPAADIQAMGARLRQRLQPVAGRPARLAKQTTPLIGRDREWRRLTQQWKRPVETSTHLTLLVGEPGIGKTRLLRDFSDWVNRQGQGVVQLRSYAAHTEMAYAPVADWLRALDPAQLLARLDEVWLVELSRLLPELRITAPDLPEPRPLAAAWQRQRLYTALTKAIFAMGERVLLSVDDIQWCDGETLNWLHALLIAPPESSPEAGKLTVVGTQRIGEATSSITLPMLLATLRQDGLLTEVALDRLSGSDTLLLAESIGGRSIEGPAAEQLYAVTEGNPLFVVESIRAAKSGMSPFASRSDVQTDGNLLDGGDAIILAALPDRIQHLLQARMAQISLQARDVAGLAAIMGREFTLDVLRAASSIEKSIDETALVGALDELWHREIIHEEQPATYDFSHGLLREVAIVELSTASRRLHHRHVALALETLHAADLDAVSARIALHCERGGDIERAITFYRRAAFSAEAVYAHSSAIRFLERALLLQETMVELPAQQALRAQLLESLGDILDFIGRHDEARSAFSRALSHVIQFEAIEHSQLYRKIGKTHEGQRDFDAALAAYAEAEAVLQQRPTKSIPAWWQAWIQIQLERLWVFYWANDWLQSATLVDQIRPSVEQYGAPPQQISFYLVRGSTAMLENRYMVSKDTLSLTQAALELAEESGERGQIAWARFVHSFGLLWHGDLQQAEFQMSDALAVAEQTGDLVHQARCTTYLAIIWRLRGHVEKTRQFARTALEASEMVQMIEYVATAAANLGWVAWRETDNSAATRQLERALTLWQQLPEGHPSASVRWTAHFPLAAIALSEGRLNDAVSSARALLRPECQRLPDVLTDTLTAADAAWHSHEEAVVRHRLSEAIQQAHSFGYL